MAYVTVPKDLTKIKSKMLFGLTKRQLVCFGSAALVGVPLFFLSKGSITRIMQSAAVVVPRLAFAKKKSGTPTSAAAPKQITCRLVSPNRTLLCIRLRSFGIVT